VRANACTIFVLLFDLSTIRYTEITNWRVRMKYRYNFRTGITKIKTKTSIAFSTTALGITGLVMSFAIPLGAGAANSTIYNNVPNPTAGNYPSQPFEAQSASEFGGQVQFAGTARENPTVTVLMSSWGCQTGHWTSGDCSTAPGATFSEPVTLNIYNVGAGDSVGSLVATSTQTFNIPYRPSADNLNCTGANAGKWYSTTDNTCYNGYATPITFSLTGVSLPNNVIISVAYNTSDYGSNPYGRTTACASTAAGCGYDSLNVALTGVASTGSQPAPNDAYFNSHLGQFYCDGGTGGVDVFRLDAGCWTGFQPMIKVDAGYKMPTNKDQCKNDGWKAYGTTFKNQGDCVSFVATGGKNQPSKP